MRFALKAPQAVLISGLIAYIACLWQFCPQLMDKGYFLSALVLGLFTIVVYRHLPVLGGEDVRFPALCRFVLLLAVGIFLVGVWNYSLLPTEKGFCTAAWFVCMYGAARYPLRRIDNGVQQSEC